MTVNRRGLLALLGAGAAAGPAKATLPVQILHPVFRHGVASGDPLQDRVILWTAVSYGLPGEELQVIWEVALDPAFARIARKGELSVTIPPAAADNQVEGWGAVKLDVTGLKPATDYWYRFRAEDVASPVGRTRTLPAGPTNDVVLAVASCALYPNGYFNAYGAIAALERVDAVIHVGDYIYEYGGPGSYGMNSAIAAERPHDPPHEIVTLADYRRRHAQYKSDPQLQAAHARAAWIVAWDDHETANDSWQGGAQNHEPEKGEGDWATRKAAALKAYYEWMPIREPAPGRTAEMANRAFQFGDVASLLMIETRLTARSRQLNYVTDLPIVDGEPDVAAFKTKWNDPERRLLGPDQLAWLADELKTSVTAGRTWQVIGNQIVMGRVAAPDFPALMGQAKWDEVVAGLDEDLQPRVRRLTRLGDLGLPYNLDAWDGYPADRERVLGAFKASGAHPLVVAGDSHTFWANQLHDASGARVAVEFAATSITSPGAGDVLRDVPVNEGFEARNEEVIYCNQAAKGFVLLTLTRDQAKAEMVAVSTITSKDYTTSALKTFTVTPAAGGGVSAIKEG